MQRLPLLLLLFSSLVIQAQPLSEKQIEKYEQIIDENGDSAVHVAYKLAIDYRGKGNEVEKFKYYCLYIVDKTKDDPTSFDHLRALRLLGIMHLQSFEPDSMNYYMDRIIDLGENSKDTVVWKFIGEAYNVKAGEHLYLNVNYDKAYPLLRKSMEITEDLQLTNSYLMAAYSLCNLIYSSEPEKVIETVEEIERKVKSFKKPAESKYIYRKVQQFKYTTWASDSTQTPMKRKEAFAFYRDLIRDFEKDGRTGDAMKETVLLTKFFGKELGQDSVLYFREKAYNFFQKNDFYQVEPDLYFQYAIGLYQKGLYRKAIPVFKEVVPLLGIKETTTTDSLIGDYHMLSEVYKSLSESYYNLGNTTVAHEYHQKFAEAVENEKNQAVDNAVSNLEVKYDVEKKENENALLLSENNVIQTRFQLSSIIGLLLLGLLGASIFFFTKMRRAKEELERINEGKNQLFEIIAHDLKGPVSSFSALSTNVSYLIKNNQSDRLLELAEYYEKAGRKINYILTNLLDWAISQKDHFVHQPQQIDIKSEVSKIIEELSYSLEQKKIKVENKVNSDQSFIFDKNAFKIITRNLIHNAIKFSHEDSTIVVDYDDFGLKIKDSGIGMEPETIQKIMKKQRVVSINGTNAEKGNGIGLSTCLKLAEQNSAKLQIESENGEGTIFTLAVG